MYRASLLVALLAFGCSMVFAGTLPKPDFIVAADGSGDFKTIQAAVASIIASEAGATLRMARLRSLAGKFTEKQTKTR